MALLRKLPATETGPGVRCTTAANEVYIVSQCMAPFRFTLWKQHPEGLEKLRTASSPLDLYDDIPW